MRGPLAALAVVLTALAAGAQVPPVCGNSVVEPPETCDDGNLMAGDGCSATCFVENLPPDCTGAVPSADDLWPPNHKLAPVSVLGVTDPDGDPVLVTVTAIAQDEPTDAMGDGTTCPDASGIGTGEASLRVERAGPGDGRVYHIAFAGDDGRGGTCTGEVEVCVRHDRRPGGTCGDGGPLFDSTGALPPCEGEGCGPEACVPDPDDPPPPACEGENPPATVEARIGRARDLLERAGDARGNRGRRLGARAARELRKAAKSAERAARRHRLSEECAAALEEQLEGAGTCAMCAAS